MSPALKIDWLRVTFLEQNIFVNVKLNCKFKLFKKLGFYTGIHTKGET